MSELKSKYAALLNALDDMQQSMVYAARKPVLRQCEMVILTLEAENASLKAALPPAMTWTTNKPTVPGWYWWRYNSQDPHPAVVKVAQGDFGLMLKYGNSEWTPIGEGGDWAGPISPPMEPPQ